MDRTGDCECRSAQYARAHLAADRQESGFKGYSDEVVGQLMRGAMRHPDFSTCALWFDR